MVQEVDNGVWFILKETHTDISHFVGDTKAPDRSDVEVMVLVQ